MESAKKNIQTMNKTVRIQITSKSPHRLQDVGVRITPRITFRITSTLPRKYERDERELWSKEWKQVHEEL
jgi:hypothetical protein